MCGTTNHSELRAYLAGVQTEQVHFNYLIKWKYKVAEVKQSKIITVSVINPVIRGIRNTISAVIAISCHTH